MKNEDYISATVAETSSEIGCPSCGNPMAKILINENKGIFSEGDEGSFCFICFEDYSVAE